MAVPKRKKSKMRVRQRRGQVKATLADVVECPECGAMQQAHHVCPKCGKYKGRQVITPKAE